MRSSIDNIDAALIHMLAERFKATQRVGRLKARHKLPPSDPQREKNQIARLKQLAANAELDPDFAEKFLNFIIEEVIRHHQALSATESDGHPRTGPRLLQDRTRPSTGPPKAELPQPTAIPAVRACLMMPGSACLSASTSSSAVVQPNVRRWAPRASSSLRPIASST